MKSLRFVLIWVFLTAAFGPAALSGETSLVETLPPPGHFEITITRDGQTVPQPGPVFTGGTEPKGMSLPYLLSNPRPIPYPRWAVRQGWRGTFILAVEILPTGAVGRWKVMQSTGYRLLDEVATKAVREWRFHPATEEGKPVVSCIQIPVHFKLQD